MSTAMFNSGAGTMFNSQASVMSVRGIPSLPEKDAEEPKQTRLVALWRAFSLSM